MKARKARDDFIDSKFGQALAILKETEEKLKNEVASL